MLRSVGFAALMAAVFLVSEASAQTQTWPYDGTGSGGGSVLNDAARQGLAEMQAEAQKMQDDLRAAANKGNAAAMFDLGTLLHQGDINHKPDLKAAYDLYEQAAAKREPRAVNLLCTAYLLGLNRPADAAKAMNDYCIRVKPVQPTALFANAYDYEHGLSGPKDDGEAFKYYMLAAKEGNGEATNAIGMKFLARSKDTIARDWFRRASAQGSINAMVSLAEMTEAGRGGFQDSDEAGWLYINAARRGHKGAAEWLAKQPASLKPLDRVSVFTPERAFITQTVEDEKGKQTHPFNAEYIADSYHSGNVIPDAAIKNHASGYAEIHCYITDEHVVDMCLIQHELPAGYNYGAILQGIFNGTLAVDPMDSDGSPTARTVMTFKYQWALD